MFVVALGVATVSAQALEPRGPGDPIGPGQPGSPPSPGGPNLGTAGGIAVYNGVDRSDRVATIQRRGAEYRVYSGNRGAALMTKKGSRIYDGQTISLQAVLFTVRAGRLIPGTSSNIATATCTIVGNQFFDGTTTTLDNLKFTLNGNRLYLENGRSLADVKYSLSGPANEDVKFILAVMADC
jgi:hypothetical protein